MKMLSAVVCAGLLVLHHEEPAKLDEAVPVVHHEKVSTEPVHTEEGPPEDAGEHHPEGAEPAEGEKGGSIVPEGDGEHPAGEQASHPAVCILLYASIIIGPAIVLMACHEDKLIRSMTYRLVEAFITIFIAVQYFSAFDELLDQGEFQEHHVLLWALTHLVVLFFVATLAAWGIRKNSSRLAVFTACGAHYVAFSACHTSEKMQGGFFTRLSEQPLFFIALLGGLAVISAATHFFRQAMAMTREEKFTDQINDLENDVIALCIGFSLANTLSGVFSGEIGGFGKKKDEDTEAEGGATSEFLQMLHTEKSTSAILAMFFVCVFAAVLSVILPKAKERDGWAKSKLMDIMKTTMTMTAAFTFLNTVDWIFHNHFPQRNESVKLFRDVMMAMVCTVIALAAIFTMAKAGVSETADVVRTVPLAVGLAAAFAWEEVFDRAVEILAESYHVIPGPNNDAPTIKVALALFSPLFLLPMYVRHVKPNVVD